MRGAPNAPKHRSDVPEREETYGRNAAFPPTTPPTRLPGCSTCLLLLAEGVRCRQKAAVPRPGPRGWLLLSTLRHTLDNNGRPCTASVWF